MADPSSETQVIPLGRMPQQVGVREAQDDWTGVINRKERRKLQNRLNQRRFRLRKQDSQAESHATDIATTVPSNLSSPSILHPLDQSGEMWECKLAPPHAREFREWFAAKAYQSYMQGAPKRDHLISLSRLNVHRAINENITAIGMTPSRTFRPAYVRHSFS
ncbi:uncharacterized protein LDX57_012837 [Aspergillus melleus]|uniref:uncharacterized protein n=1 Tax=Aspergillus melleus TaxID=138277 RepID=UPI001E8CC062|nr:uncharacterized protein LDX57_012837 [Aspergillus melleus]KAH8435208.1 hypothetical protein LDX57_012837 [Aspergillus melleus]